MPQTDRQPRKVPVTWIASLLTIPSFPKTDGTTVIGGTVGQIPLTAAAFTPAPADAGGAPAAPAAPVAEAPPAAVAPGAGTAATTTLTGTTTIVVTVIPGATAVIAGAAAAGLAG